MTFYQLKIRINHFFRARHWRGAAIHSPAMYGFVREYALINRGKALIDAIGAPVVKSVQELKQRNLKDDEEVLILQEPFINRSEHMEFNQWYEQNHVVTAHFQGLIVIFFDKKLQKEQYIIRN